MDRCEVEPVGSGWGLVVVSADGEGRPFKRVFASRAEADATAVRISEFMRRSHARWAKQEAEWERARADAQRLNAEWIAKGRPFVR